MIIKKKSLITISILILSLDISIVMSRIKFCEIKFNEKRGVEALKRKINKQERYQYSRGGSRFYCYKIGVEHDKSQNPINEKPIYACCKSQ